MLTCFSAAAVNNASYHVIEGRKVKNYSLLLITMLVPTVSFANYLCEGKITHLGISDDSSLYVDNGFGVHKLCNSTDTYCKDWKSLALAAKMADKAIKIHYRNSASSSSDACTDIGSWVTPDDKPYYMEMN